MPDGARSLQLPAGSRGSPAVRGTWRHVALLRGINVGGRTARMSDLKGAFESFGLSGVSTYIQSGNVLFTSKEADMKALALGLERHLKAVLGYQVGVFVLEKADLEEAAANNPFEPERLDGEQHCHLMFLSDEPEASRREALMALQGEEYRFAVRGKVFYYVYPRAFEGPRRRNINFERVLGVAGTARTWKVVHQLIELLGRE